MASKEIVPDTGNKPQTYGYVRVSTKKQNINRQLDAMQDAGVDSGNIFIDRASGKNFDRPAYQKLLGILKPGDTVLLHSLDRFGRDFIEMLLEWITITAKLHVKFKVLDSELLSTDCEVDLDHSFFKALALLMYSYTAAKERIATSIRQMQGIKAAQARGKKFGRPRLALPENFEDIYMEYMDKRISGYEAARLVNMSVATFYRRVRERKEAKE